MPMIMDSVNVTNVEGDNTSSPHQTVDDSDNESVITFTTDESYSFMDCGCGLSHASDADGESEPFPAFTEPDLEAYETNSEVTIDDEMEHRMTMSELRDYETRMAATITREIEARLEREFAAKERENAQLMQEITEMKAAHSNRIQQMEKSTKSYCLGTISDLVAAHGKTEEQRNLVNHLAHKNLELERHLEEINREFFATEKKLIDANHAIEDLETDCRAKKIEVTSAEWSLSATKNELEQREEFLAAYAHRHEELSRLLTEASATAKKHDEAIIEAHKVIAQLKDCIEAKDVELQSANDAIRDSDSQRARFLARHLRELRNLTEEVRQGRFTI